MGSFEDKACRFVFSLVVLWVMASMMPTLGYYIGLNTILGYGLGLIYIKDRYLLDDSSNTWKEVSEKSEFPHRTCRSAFVSLGGRARS